MAQDRGHVACIFRRGAMSIGSHSAIWIECLVKKLARRKRRRRNVVPRFSLHTMAGEK